MLRGNLYLVRIFMARSLRDTLGAVRAYMLGILDHLSPGLRHTYLACFSLDVNHLSSDGQEQRSNSTSPVSMGGSLSIPISVLGNLPRSGRGLQRVNRIFVAGAATFWPAPQNISKVDFSHKTRLRAMLRSCPQLLPRVQNQFVAQAQTASSISWRDTLSSRTLCIF
jgi:hypothetical protein